MLPAAIPSQHLRLHPLDRKHMLRDQQCHRYRLVQHKESCNVHQSSSNVAYYNVCGRIIVCTQECHAVEWVA